MNKDLFGNDYNINFQLPKGKYKIFRYKNNYKLSDNEKKCKNCINSVYVKGYTKNYYKCKLQGIASSETSDIRLRNVCDLWEK